MTRNDPHEGQDLSGLLHDLADDAVQTPRARSLTSMAAIARTHGLAARRRRTAARSLVAAASVAVVAVGGVLVAQNLGGDTVPPPASAPTTPGACGTDLTPPTGGIDGLDLVLATAEPPLTAASLADLPDVVAVLHEGAAEKKVTLGSTGYVGYTVVKDGRVVAAPGPMPEPYTEVELAAGGEPSSPFNRTTSVACDTSGTLPAGTYEVWATLDGTAPGNTARTVTVVGGPWTVSIAAPNLTMGTHALVCGSESVPGIHESGQDTYRLEAIGPERTVTPTAVLPDLLRLDPALLDGSTQARTIMGVWVYLARDGKIVSAHKTEGTELLAWFGPDGAAGTMPGTAPIIDGLRVDGTATACDGSGLLPAGEYDAWAAVELGSAEADGIGRTVIASDAVPVTFGASSGQPAPTMLTCGAPTSEITSSTEAGGDAATLTLDGTVTRLPSGASGAKDATGAVKAQIRHAKSSTSWYLGDTAQVYVLRDETVVASARTRQGTGGWATGTIPATTDLAVPVIDALVADVPTTDCDGAPLPDGTYTLLVVVPVKQMDGTTETATEIISLRQNLTIGGGPALPGKDASATFPACRAEVPGAQGDMLEIIGTPEKVTVGLEFAHNGEMTVKNISESRLRGSFPDVIRGVLTLDGVVVGRLPEVSGAGLTNGYDLAPQGTTGLAWITDLRSCTAGGDVGAGTYEVWAPVTFTGADGTTASAVGHVATLTIDPERVTD